MSEIGKKLNYPQTSQIPDEKTRVYARKLTRVLDDLKRYIDERLSDITINLGVSDHGALTGLQDIEDHLYAFLHDGSRAFTAYGPGFSNDTLLADADPFSAVSEYAIKAYVDALLAYILASPVGSIIYVWDNDGTHYLERLIPGQYGQVLTTGGANQRPFWDWVWLAPGGDFGGEIFFRVWLYAQVQECTIIDMDVEHTVQAGGFTSVLRDGINDSEFFVAYHPAQGASLLSANIIAMDETKQITVTMIVEEGANPSASPSNSPSATPSTSPSTSVSPSLSPSVSPSVSPSASPSASVSPSVSPSLSPSISPSVSPSISPSVSPSASPSV